MIIVYGREDCPWCEQAIGVLQGFKSEYKYLKLDEDISTEDFKKKYPHIEYLPAIIVNDEYLGSYDELCGYMVEIYGGGTENFS